MKSLLMAMFTIVATLVMQPANAQTSANEILSKDYWGVGFGNTKSDIDLCDIADCDDKSTGIKVFRGIGDKNFAIEGGFAAYRGGEATLAGNKNEAHFSSVFGDLIGRFPVGERVTLFGRFGGHYWRFLNDYQGGDDKDDGFGWHYGFGGEFHFNAKNSIRFEFERFEAEVKANGGVGDRVFESKGDFDVDITSVSYIRRF